MEVHVGRGRERSLPGKVLGILVLCVASCSDSSGGGGSATNVVQGYVVEMMGPVFSGIARLKALTPVLLFPPAASAAGISFVLDPRGAPNTYDFSIPLDSNANGSLDTSITGRAVFTADPTDVSNLVAGFSGSVTIQVTTSAGKSFDAVLELAINASGRFTVSGTGDFDDGAGSTVSLAVDSASPLVVRTATNEPDERPNACNWTVDGSIDVQASNADGDYSATWGFDPSSIQVAVTDAVFTPPGGTQEQLASSRFRVSPCPGAGTVQDWAGVYTFDWFCIPSETGQSTLTITVLDSTTIEIMDEHPPGSGNVLVYQATREPNDPHLVHGTFSETDGGGTYEEAFLWVLAEDLATFSQVSEYLYSSGPLAGTGGICGGTASRN